MGTFNEAKAALHLTLMNYYKKNLLQNDKKVKNRNEIIEIKKKCKADMNRNFKNFYFDSTNLPIVLLTMIKFVDFQNGSNENIFIKNNANVYKVNDNNNEDNNPCNDGDEDDIDEDDSDNNDIKEVTPIVIDRKTFLDEGEDSKNWIPRYVKRTPVVIREIDDCSYLSVYT